MFLLYCISTCMFVVSSIPAPLSCGATLAADDTNMVHVQEIEEAIVTSFNSLPADRKHSLINRLISGVQLLAIEKDKSLRCYMLCETIQALIAIRKLYNSGELKPIIESLLNELLADSPQFGPVSLQHLYLIDYCKAEQYFTDQPSGKKLIAKSCTNIFEYIVTLSQLSHCLTCL